MAEPPAHTTRDLMTHSVLPLRPDFEIDQASVIAGHGGRRDLARRMSG